jgi:hypothetical protein
VEERERGRPNRSRLVSSQAAGYTGVCNALHHVCCN